MKLNQDDLARRLGISRTTVSRSFSNHPAINPETRARVLALAEELGYRYSVPRSGRARERLQTKTLGILIGTPRLDDHTAHTFQAVLKGISERAATDRIQPASRKLPTTATTPTRAAMAPSVPASSQEARTTTGPTNAARRTVFRAILASTSTCSPFLVLEFTLDLGVVPDPHEPRV